MGILADIKQVLGVAGQDYFDPDLIMGINTVFSDLHLLGAGPELGFEITGDTEEWSDFFGDDTPKPTLNMIKSFVTLKTQLMFDPPDNSFLLAARERMVTEYAYKINMKVDISELALTTVLDGGNA